MDDDKPTLRMDARVLVWGLVIVLVTGTILMIGYRPRSEEVAPWAAVLVDAHAAATFWVVWGTLGHLVWRTARSGATVRGVRSGAWAAFSLGIAAVTGAFAAPGMTWQTITAPFGDDVVLGSTVVHVAYASILLLLTVYMHVARWGWRQVLGDLLQAVTAAGLTLVFTVLGGAAWSILVVPPIQVLWAWTLLLPLAVWLGSRRLARPDQ